MLTALLLVTIVLELLMFTPLLWRIRLLIAGLLAFLIPATTVGFIFMHPSWLTIIVALFSLFRLLNIFRIAKNRLHERYLYNATRRTSLVFTGAQALVVCLLLYPVSTNASWERGITLIVIIQALSALMLLAITFRNISKTRYRQGTNFYSDSELPTVSVLIPARNETYDLEECLRSALMSDYPKLEIIVLDDCSQLKTSDIIKGFAHDGVRFIKGQEPTSKWLAKNLAYERLRDEASGELLLFCGVDTRFGSHTLRALVTELLVRDKDMISIVPRRLSGELSNAFIQPMRYWWELALPRTLLNKPAVLSTCWLIRSETLAKLGGFAAIGRSIIPERHLARSLIQTNKYSFIRANDTLDVSTKKSFHDQQETAIRLKYPQLSRKPELVVTLVLGELIVLLGPFAVLLYSIATHNLVLGMLSLIPVFTLAFIHTTIVYLTNPPNSIVAIWNFPLAVLSEILVTVASMVQYEFGDVTWKNRSVCIPVMNVIPRLPNSNN